MIIYYLLISDINILNLYDDDLSAASNPLILEETENIEELQKAGNMFVYQEFVISKK